jgi:hypothetical protein
MYKKKSKQKVERCPAGYLTHGAHLCGRSGNQCVDICHFEYLCTFAYLGSDKRVAVQQSLGAEHD